MSWLFAALLALAVLVLLGAEWPRLSGHVGLQARDRRARAKRKQSLKLIRTETDDFAASVQRDLESLPTLDRDPRR